MVKRRKYASNKRRRSSKRVVRRRGTTQQRRMKGGGAVISAVKTNFVDLFGNAIGNLKELSTSQLTALNQSIRDYIINNYHRGPDVLEVIYANAKLIPLIYSDFIEFIQPKLVEAESSVIMMTFEDYLKAIAAGRNRYTKMIGILGDIMIMYLKLTKIMNPTLFNKILTKIYIRIHELVVDGSNLTVPPIFVQALVGLNPNHWMDLRDTRTVIIATIEDEGMDIEWRDYAFLRINELPILHYLIQAMAIPHRQFFRIGKWIEYLINHGADTRLKNKAGLDAHAMNEISCRNYSMIDDADGQPMFPDFYSKTVCKLNVIMVAAEKAKVYEKYSKLIPLDHITRTMASVLKRPDDDRDLYDVMEKIVAQRRFMSVCQAERINLAKIRALAISFHLPPHGTKKQLCERIQKYIQWRFYG